MILQALAVAPDLPLIQARADVVLRAAEGLTDDQIAAACAMRRKDVLHWKKRFAAHGVRGLWDPPGPGPKKRVSPEQEAAVLQDVFYSALHWDAALLAQKHGLSRAAVNRIFTKHGIVRGRWGRIDIEHLKVFADPLLGVTISGIAGLHYGVSGVLALASTSRPFSELHFVNAQSSVSEAIDGFLDVLGKLAEIRRASPTIFPIPNAAEEAVFMDWLNQIESRRESIAEVHLLMDLPNQAPYQNPGVQEWLRQHPHFKVLHAPIVRGLCWPTFVRRCLKIISGLPVQVSLVKDLKAVAQYLAGMPDQDRVGTIGVLHSVQR